MSLGPEQVGILAVWINMLEGDDWGAAKRAAQIYEPFPHVKQFHDPHQRIGKALATSVQHPEEIAWDFYVFYKPGDHWLETPPHPHDWIHQLGQKEWPDPDKYFWGDKLAPALRQCMTTLIES